MLPLNQYTAAEREIYFDTICGRTGGYEMKVTVQILTNQRAVVSTVSARLLDGQVDVAAPKMSGGTVEVSRTAHLQFTDPAHSLSFDSNSPTDGALYLDRLIRVIVSVRCSFGWVDVPVFTGPVTGVNRDGDIVDVNAAGMETFALRSAWEKHTYKYGLKVEVVRSLLVRAGVRTKYIQLPTGSRAHIGKPVVVGRESVLWNKAFPIVSSMDRVLFADARGIFRTNPKNTKPVMTFKTGPGGQILSDVQVSFNTENMKNAVIVVGPDPSGPKKAATALVVAPRSHQLSPYSIGLDPETGRGGYLTVRDDNSHVRTHLAAVKRGQAILRDVLVMSTEATWDGLPMWHLEPWDIVTLATDKFSGVVRVNKFSLPLRADAVATYGYQRDLSKPHRYVRSAA